MTIHLSGQSPVLTARGMKEGKMSEDKKLWEQVKEIEEKEIDHTLDIIIATLLVNYGKEGRCIPDIINGEEIPKSEMLIKVCEFYHKQYVENAALRAELAEKDREIAAIRELMNCYNVGGWTDSVEPMKRALKAEDELAELRERLKPVMDKGKI